MFVGSVLFIVEVVFVVALGNKVAAIVQEKGREAYNFVYVFAVLFFVGEFTAFVLAYYCVDENYRINVEGVGRVDPYLCGVVGAAIGGAIGFVIALNAAPDPHTLRQDLEEDDEEDAGAQPMNAETGVKRNEP